MRFDNADGTVDYYNPITRELVGINKYGTISTYHKVNRSDKVERLDKQTKDYLISQILNLLK